MPQVMNPESYHPIAEHLKNLMRGINARNGSLNCGRVALRLDEYLSAGENLGLAPVATQRAPMFLDPIFKINDKGHLKITRSYTKHSTLLSRCSTKPAAPNEILDVSEDNKVIYELDVDFEFVNQEAASEIRLQASNSQDIIEALQNLPKRKFNQSAHGFLFYTWENNKIAHVANFFVDKDKQVFFLDAQGKEESSWVSPNPPAGYRAEIFYLQTLTAEGFIIKPEPALHQSIKLANVNMKEEHSSDEDTETDDEAQEAIVLSTSGPVTRDNPNLNLTPLFPLFLKCSEYLLEALGLNQHKLSEAIWGKAQAYQKLKSKATSLKFVHLAQLEAYIHREPKAQALYQALQGIIQPLVTNEGYQAWKAEQPETPQLKTPTPTSELPVEPLMQVVEYLSKALAISQLSLSEAIWAKAQAYQKIKSKNTSLKFAHLAQLEAYIQREPKVQALYQDLNQALQGLIQPLVTNEGYQAWKAEQPETPQLKTPTSSSELPLEPLTQVVEYLIKTLAISRFSLSEAIWGKARAYKSLKSKTTNFKFAHLAQLEAYIQREPKVQALYQDLNQALQGLIQPLVTNEGYQAWKAEQPETPQLKTPTLTSELPLEPLMQVVEYLSKTLAISQLSLSEAIWGKARAYQSLKSKTTNFKFAHLTQLEAYIHREPKAQALYQDLNQALQGLIQPLVTNEGYQAWKAEQPENCHPASAQPCMEPLQSSHFSLPLNTANDPVEVPYREQAPRSFLPLAAVKRKQATLKFESSKKSKMTEYQDATEPQISEQSYFEKQGPHSRKESSPKN